MIEDDHREIRMRPDCEIISPQKEQIRLARPRWPLHQETSFVGQSDYLQLIRVELALLPPPGIHRHYSEPFTMGLIGRPPTGGAPVPRADSNAVCRYKSTASRKPDAECSPTNNSVMSSRASAGAAP